MAKGRTFLKQGVGIRDTEHGSLDLPVTVGKRMKKPKMRYGDGGVASGPRRLKNAKTMGYAKGGTVSRDGCAIRGLTKGRVR